MSNRSASSEPNLDRNRQRPQPESPKAMEVVPSNRFCVKENQPDAYHGIKGGPPETSVPNKAKVDDLH